MMNTHNISTFIVEDDVFFANMIQEHLSQKGYNNSKLFHNGEEFLNHLHEGPSLVILDFNLGGMNGIDVLRQIKGVNPNIQVIFLSAQEDMEVAIKSLKYGAYDYLRKNAETLSRLEHSLQRIIQTNQIILKNDQLVNLKKWLFAAIAALSSLFFFLK